MRKIDEQSRLHCAHYVPTNIDCSIEKDYRNRPFDVPLTKLSNASDNSQIKSPNTFYARSNNQTKNGIVRMPRSTLVQRSTTCNAQATFPGDFDKHAHRFTRSFSWKTKPEESSFAQMQPLPKLIKRPGYLEMCFKNICWPTHQMCLCCGRNTAESCRKWSKSTGEYNYMDACWSSCALCSDDAYKILNTPVVYNEKIIDPEVLLPLDAELLYYSIQSAKRQQQSQNPLPFTINSTSELKELRSPLKTPKSNVQLETIGAKSPKPQAPTPSAIKKKKRPRKIRSSKSKTSSRSKGKSKKRKTSTRSKKPSKRPKTSHRSKRRSKRKSKKSSRSKKMKK